MTSAHDFSARTIDGQDQKLSDFAGKALLVVNVASQCGLTPQYTGLEKLHRELGAKGLAVVGFPCNQFGAQEPGTEEEIKTFCSTKYDVSFPLFAKIEVNGAGAHPLYQWMESEPTTPAGPGDIKWNFEKFLIGKDGALLARFAPTVTPEDPGLRAAIEAALA